MGCYLNTCKNTCSKIVIGVSLILGILGVVTIGYGAAQTSGSVKTDNQWTGDFQVKKSGYGMPVIVCGAFALLTSILGCATGKFKNPCVAIPFGLLTLVIGIILCAMGLIIGALMTGMGA